MKPPFKRSEVYNAVRTLIKDIWFAAYAKRWASKK
jgi:hypothetical protein